MVLALRRRTPLAAAGRGLVAGAIGTAAMTAWQEFAARLQSAASAEEAGSDEGQQDGGDEAAWEHAPAPAQVARRIAEGVFHRRLPPRSIPAVAQAMHWAYGTGWGALYGVLRDSTDARGLREGAAWGAAVWTASYIQLVPLGLYQPPWKYPPKELALDLSYHLVYGAALVAAYRALEP